VALDRRRSLGEVWADTKLVLIKIKRVMIIENDIFFIYSIVTEL
jgi:hypothetical protein